MVALFGSLLQRLARRTSVESATSSTSATEVHEEDMSPALLRRRSRLNMQVLVDLPVNAMFHDVSPPGSPRDTEKSALVKRGRLRPRGNTVVLRNTRPVAATGEEVCLSRWHAGELPKDCAICLETLEPGDLVQPMANCRHAFHAHCAKLWLQAQPSSSQAKCPECRGPAMVMRAQLSEEEGKVALPPAQLLGL